MNTCYQHHIVKDTYLFVINIALDDDDTDVIDEYVVEGVHDGLPTEAAVEPKPALPLGCRCRVPLTRVHNPSGVLLLYRDHLDEQTLN